VPAALAAANANWNAGGSILTFYFPVGLFVVIAVLLYLQLSRPHKVPGHRQLATSATGSGMARPAPETTDTAGQDDQATSAVGPPPDDGE
jgi:hypothetical protein